MNLNLLPNGQTFRGVFHVALGGFAGSYNLDTYWVPYVAAAKSVGANFIAYFGSVTDGYGNMTQYLAHRKEVADYLASQSMFALSYSMGYTPDLWTGSVSLAHAIEVYAADVAQQAACPNVIGDVIVDEALASYTGYGGSMSSAAVVAFLADAYATGKAGVPAHFPICATPNPCGQIGLPFTYTGDNKDLCDSVAPYCDFLVFHPFYPMVNADFAAVSAAYPTKDLIFPSSVAKGTSDAALADSINGVFGSVGFGKVRGAGLFTLADWVGDGGLQYGMFDDDALGTPRASASVPFEANIPASPDIYGAFMAPGQLASVRYASFKARGYAP